MNSISIFTDPVVTCPYDKCHRVALSKIRSHIVKCEKNFPEGYKKTCPYNATHRLFDHELQDHLQVCPQRMLLEPETYQRVRNHGSRMSDFLAQSITDTDLDHGEPWDEDCQGCEVSLNGGSTYSDNRPNRNQPDNLLINLRRPRGYSEVMMIGGESDTPEISDMESVVSVMGVGRGKINQNNIDLYKRLNFGRGRCLTRIE